MNKIQKTLYKYQDLKYAQFESTLTPGVDKSLFIGVRVPVMRQFAKEIHNTDEAKEFIKVTLFPMVTFSPI